MKKQNIATPRPGFAGRNALFILAGLFLCWPPFLAAETLTLTTYYPAPYGAYASILTTDKTLLARDKGNVGIGIPNPAAKLDVAGMIKSTYGSAEGASLSLVNPWKTGLGNEWKMYNMTGGYGNSLQFWNYGGTGGDRN